MNKWLARSPCQDPAWNFEGGETIKFVSKKILTGSLSGSETETSSCYRLWIFLSCSLLKIDPPMFRLKKDATVIEKSYDAKPFLSLKIGRSLFQSEQKILKEVSMRILSKLIYLWSDRQIFEFPVNFRSNFRGKNIRKKYYWYYSNFR